MAVALKVAPSGLTYAAGVSQRKAAEILSLLLGHRYSHETLSALTDEVLEAAGAFRGRLLPEEMAFVYLDGLSLKVFREGEGIVRETVYVALGVTPSGERRVLGFWLLPTESALGWEGVLGELWQRGLRRVLLFITDGLPGLSEAKGLPSGGVAAVRGARGAGAVGGRLRGLPTLLRVPQGALAVLAEHQPDGAVYP